MFRRIAGGLAGGLVAALVVTLPTAVPELTEPAAAAERLTPPAEKVDSDGGPAAAGKTWAHNRVKDRPAPKPLWPGATKVTAAKGVGVRLLDRAALPEQWRDRLVLSLSGPSTVSVDYNSFRYAVGGGWASRLRLWQVPSCALSTPEAPACRSTPIRSVNDAAAGVIRSAGTVTPQNSYVVLAAAGSGSDGDYSATSLSPSGSWNSGGNTGEFTWSYPLRTPPTTGPAPDISLSYSSQTVDGRSEVTNNQPSMIGEGFEYSPGYVERRYVPCWDDRGTGANNTRDTDDQCWKSDNATMSLNGRNSELVFQPGKGWHMRSEDGTRVEKLTGGANGDDNGEHWRVTTTDGTQYHFGLDALPGQADRTNSTLLVPVYGNHSGEQCFTSGDFAGSSCVQAWRWQLDYVVDVRGNTMSYWYGKETNKYAKNRTDADDTPYDRAGHLKRIDYGTYDRTADVHGVTERSLAPRGQVEFEHAGRCLTNCGTEAAPVKESWKDTPWDQECKAGSCPQKYAPTFWTTKRLAKITTRVWDTTKETPGWQDVDSWTLTHTFSATADSTHTGLWLDRIDHTGHVGGTATVPPVTFGAVSLANRVLTANGTTHNWLRISDIVTEGGGRIHVDYSRPDCTETSLPAPHTNDRRCYPVLVLDPLDPAGKRLKTEWWHMYRAEHVAQDDIQQAAGHPARSVHTWYEYVGAPAWRYADDDGVTKPERRTWSQMRGYATVKTRIGDNASADTTLTVTHFLRGMHGDRAAPGGGARTVTVPASLGDETVYDEDQFSGQVREQIVYNGTDTKPVSKVVHVPWRSEPTATRNGAGGTVEARFTAMRVSWSAEALGRDGARGWRVTRKVDTLDPEHGTIVTSQDDGDVAAAGDEVCTRNTYNRNLDKNLTEVVRQTTVTALPCDREPGGVDDVVSDDRFTYDGATSPATAPRYGSPTRTEQMKDWTAATGTVWQTVGQNTYRPDGLVSSATDIRGNVTGTAYTPPTGGPVTAVTTTGPAPGWSSRVELNPYWGSAVKDVDPNGRVTTETAYDPLGRTAKVWRLGWSRSGHENQPSAGYTYHFAPERNANAYVVTRSLNSDGNVLSSYQILDGLLRPRQSQVPSAAGDGNRVVTDTIYDQYGLASTSYGAHVEPGAASGSLWYEPEWSVPAVSRTHFDRASRAVAEVFLSGDGRENLVEKWRTTTGYEGDRTMVTPPSGGVATTTLSDIEGRTVALRQHTTAAGVTGDHQETRYHYDRKGNQVRMTDPAGNEWTAAFDARGREIRTTDPDKGAVTTTYNDAGDPVTVRDARGEVLWHGYDVIGRQTELRDDSASGALRAQWKYDTLYTGQAGLRGQLTETIRYEPAGSANAYKWQVRQFDGRYQPRGVNYVVPAVEGELGQTYVYGWTYAETTGDQLTASIPSGPAGKGLPDETLTTGYDATTDLPIRLDTRIGGSPDTLATASYTPYGEVNGTTRKIGQEDLVQDVTYRDEATRRITRTTAADVSDRTYTYDQSGDITEIAEPDDKQCFRYDKLAQLTRAWTPRTAVGCAAEPAVAALGGPAPYWQDWTINSTGSRLTEVTRGSAGDTTRTYQVPDGGAGVARPHAMTGMTTTEPGKPAVTSSYAYDAAGNTVCRPTGPAPNDCAGGARSQTLAWDAEGRVAQISADGRAAQTNVYDPDGGRIIRRDPAGTTLYLPGQEFRLQNGTITGTRYYGLAGGVVAFRTGGSAPENLTWLYVDHQGTQQTSVNAHTNAVTIRRQTPYGGPRGERSLWPTGKGFVGGDDDPAGLVHVGAREYDSTTGRFISVDPLMDPADPHQWNGYSYANNSPVTLSDPDGRDPGGGDACDRGMCSPTWGQTGGGGGSGGAPPPPAQNDNPKKDKNRKKPGCGFKCKLGGFTKKAAGAWYGASNDIVMGTVNAVVDRYQEAWRTWEEEGIVGAAGWVAVNVVCGPCVLYTTTVDTVEGIGASYGAAYDAARSGDWENAARNAIVGTVAAASLVAPTVKLPVRAAPRAAPKSAPKTGPPAEPKPASNSSRRGSCPLSFSGDTAVLMADGTAKPIRDVKPGDKVQALDPETGESGAREVTHVWVHQDDLASLELAGGAAVTTTEDHLFWNETDQQWQRADALDRGEFLSGPAGKSVAVAGFEPRTSHRASAYNLTVADLHTYYVFAGRTPVLVHNDGSYIPAPKDLPGFPDARRVKPRTAVKGGGGMRARWEDKTFIYEWDSQHGEVEKYNKKGKHLGAFDANTGEMMTDGKGKPKGPNSGRTCGR